MDRLATIAANIQARRDARQAGERPLLDAWRQQPQQPSVPPRPISPAAAPGGAAAVPPPAAAPAVSRGTAQEEPRMPRDQVMAIQQRLRAAGFDPGPIDGLWGPRTQRAFDMASAVQSPQAPMARPGSNVAPAAAVAPAHVPDNMMRIGMGNEVAPGQPMGPQTGYVGAQRLPGTPGATAPIAAPTIPVERGALPLLGPAYEPQIHDDGLPPVRGATYDAPMEPDAPPGTIPPPGGVNAAMAAQLAEQAGAGQAMTPAPTDWPYGPIAVQSERERIAQDTAERTYRTAPGATPPSAVPAAPNLPPQLYPWGIQPPRALPMDQFDRRFSPPTEPTRPRTMDIVRQFLATGQLPPGSPPGLMAAIQALLQRQAQQPAGPNGLTDMQLLNGSPGP